MAYCFSWPGREGETAYITDAIEFPLGYIGLYPNKGAGYVVWPDELPAHELDRLTAGVTTLADYHRSNADRLDETAQRLALVQPVVSSF